MKSILLFIGALLIMPVFTGNAQSLHRKGEMYGYWGWNRGWFSKSDIHFSGTHYDFVLEQAKAKDKPEPFALRTYFGPSLFTIPQYNYRLGFFFHQDWDISAGMDHMKYVVQAPQSLHVHGYIHETSTEFDGEYEHRPIILTDDFLHFEHTDGLNYLNLEVRRYFKLLHRKHADLEAFAGLGAGMLIPRTNATLWTKKRYDEFHVSGYGTDVLTGLRITLFKYAFIQTETKGGFIHMPDIRTSHDLTDKAQQHFFFAQWNVVFGGRWFILKNDQ
jgi:hypothetical protein